MDHIELWDKAKALMREELANVSYTTWIEQPLKPVYVVVSYRQRPHHIVDNPR